jgi:hypothetical protein
MASMSAERLIGDIVDQRQVLDMMITQVFDILSSLLTNLHYDMVGQAKTTRAGWFVNLTP